MNRSRLLIPALAALLISARAQAVQPVPRAQYLEYARSAADWTWTHYDSLVGVWKQRFDPHSIFGYNPPSWFLDMATIYAVLYDLEGKPEYAARAKKVLLTFGEFRKYYTKEALARRPDYSDGLPVAPGMFIGMRYIRPYALLKDKIRFSRRERQLIEKNIAEIADYTIRTQEWGPMNRGIIRAEILAWASRAVPKHPHARYWRMTAEAIGSDSWGQWEIEDASHYHGIWLYGLLSYADATGRLDELFRLPEMRYYAEYYLHLMCPDGMVPDFGDAYWRSDWQRYLPFFEAAASAYKEPGLKWAAARIARKFIDFSKPARSSGLGVLLLDAYRWASDDVPAEEPSSLSEEVMEDVVGKKIVFRNGWGPKSTYFLLNYRDEGDGGLLYRDYLRDTIPIEEEKATHGHSDENSVVLLMANGSVLLHDGGYRDFMPSGMYGAYRQDYFHNRLCVRREKMWMGQRKGEYRYSVRDSVPGQSVLDFLHDAGSYRRVRTYKIDFLTFDDFDYSRTRVVDDGLGYQWDRAVVWVKDPGWFVVFDVFQANTPDYFTAANLWHTRKILARGPHWYDTVYDSLRRVVMPTDTHLLVYFPKTHYRLEGVERENRYWQKEWVIHQTATQYFERGEHVGFVTILIPHSKEEDPAELLQHVRLLDPQPDRAGLGVVLSFGDRKVVVGLKRDLRMDMVRDWRRPKYTYAAGRIRYGDFETNADLLFARVKGNTLHYTAVNCTRVDYADRTLWAQKPTLFGLAFDGSPDQPGVAKVRYWRDKVELK